MYIDDVDLIGMKSVGDKRSSRHVIGKCCSRCQCSFGSATVYGELTYIACT